MRKYLTIFILLILIFVPQTYAQNHSELRVSPVLLNILLSPGKTYEYDVTIENLSNNPAPLRLELDSLVTDDDGKINLNAAEDSPLITWTTIEPREILVPAKGTRTVQVTVQIPPEVKLGGYYAFMFLDPVITNQQQVSTVNARIGIPLLANIGVFDPNSIETTVEEFTLDSFQGKKTVTTSFKVRNKSLYHFSAKPVLEIQPLFGNKIELPYEEKIIFPGKSRSWETQNTIQDLVPGFYKTVLKVSVGNGRQISLNAWFIYAPLTTMIISILIITLVTFAVIKWKNIGKAIRVFFSSKE